MTPAQFIARWKGSTLTERAGAQAHFDDLCELLGVAVAATYGWMDYTPDMPDEEILRRLLAINLERAAET